MNSFLGKNAVYTLMLCFFGTIAIAQSNKLKVVLDAGHGGKDAGASYHGYVEKKIALNVVLKIGSILEKDPSIDVVYTRKTDVFVELIERANIANREKANLFISVHCNGVVDNAAYGTETFVMGLTKYAKNLEIAKRENMVIELEKDYKTTYKGFDPKSPQTSLGLSLYKDVFLDHSINVAGRIEQNFKNDLKKKSRGVKQLPLWVLDATVMPGVLIELGFLSNPTEGAYLNSDKGQDELAESIVKAILDYKKEFYGSSNTNDQKNKPKNEVIEKVEEPKQPIVEEVKTTNPIVSKENKTPETTNSSSTIENTTDKGVVFKVQISASGNKLALEPSKFNGLTDLSVIQEGNLYKYLYGNSTTYDAAKQLLSTAKSKGYTSAYIVAFKDGKRINLQEAIK